MAENNITEKAPKNPKNVGPQMNYKKLVKKLESFQSTINFSQKEGMIAKSMTCCCGDVIQKYTIETRQNGSQHAHFRNSK